jgi:hypothetical protein|tara:strand:- start:1305 stop:1568 length:264 start_codon:yes stop_codon:yes gene_type:complete
MFVLTLANQPDGVYSVYDEEDKKVIPIFQLEDDADRYLLQLQENISYPKMEVVEMEDHVIIDACQQRGQPFTVITPDDLLIPPDNLV